MYDENVRAFVLVNKLGVYMDIAYEVNGSFSVPQLRWDQ